jgi:hypothetical protein
MNMENRNATPSIAKPSIFKDDFELVRRPSLDEIADPTELVAFREACRHTRLGRSMVVSETMISKE